MSYSPVLRFLQRMTPENGWQSQLIRDQHGRPDRIVAVRVGPTWTDAVAIEAEHRCVALRLRTDDDSPLIVPGEDSASGAVWQRDGACADVLAELFELTQERPQ
jgi:hypothetical protein